MKTRTYFIHSIFVLTCLFQAACSEQPASEDSSSESVLTIGGSLGGPSGSSAKATQKARKVGALAITDYSVRCVTLTGTPAAGVGAVGADGSFSLTISGIDGSTSVPLGCFIISNIDSSIKATLAFDSGSEGMAGGNATSGSVNCSGGEAISFGEISFDEDKGTAVVEVANIARTGTVVEETGTFADVTGDWLLNCVDTDEYDCPEDIDEGDFVIHLNQIQADDDVAVRHTGLSIWDSSAFGACGSTEDLDALLPAGWSAVNAALNTNFSFSAFPASSAVQARAHGGSTGACEMTITEGMTCNQILNGGTASGANNTDGWGNGNIGAYSDADCQAICLADSVHEVEGSCQPRYSVNHNFTRTVNAAGQIATEVANYNEGTGTTPNNFIRREKNPDGRFVISELLTAGNIGTLLQSDSYTEHFCQDNGVDGCTDRACVIQENVRVTMTQSSSTAAVVEVVISRALDTSVSAAECSQDVPGNYLFNELSRTEQFLMNAAKQ